MPNPTLYDNFSQVRQYIDQQGSVDLSSYVTKSELSGMSYATTSQLPVIDENIIPKDTATYTLGDNNHIYSNTYSRGVYLGTGVRMFSESSASSNDMAISLGGVSYFFLNSNRFAPNGAANNEKLDLGTTDRKWNHIYGKSVNVDTTYTNNISLGSHQLRQDQYSIGFQINGNNTMRMFVGSFRPWVDKGATLGSSANQWSTTYTANIYADNAYISNYNNFIWTGTSTEYAALSDYTTYQLYLIENE